MSKINVTIDEGKLLVLEKLVDELSRVKPRTQIVKEYMQKAGFEYTSDPIDRLDMVLKEIHFIEAERELK